MSQLNQSSVLVEYKWVIYNPFHFDESIGKRSSVWIRNQGTKERGRECETGWAELGISLVFLQVEAEPSRPSVSIYPFKSDGDGLYFYQGHGMVY